MDEAYFLFLSITLRLWEIFFSWLDSFHSRAHQCHYEQLGDVQGHVSIDGNLFQLSLNVMRDHTHGSTRDWRLMHRYGIQNFATKNGFRWGLVDLLERLSLVTIFCKKSLFISQDVTLNVFFRLQRVIACLLATRVHLLESSMLLLYLVRERRNHLCITFALG